MRSALLLSVLVLTGCAATVAVPPSALADTQARLDGRRVTVVLANGTAWRADALRLGPDSTSWFDAADGEIRAVPTASVVQIEHRDRGRQAKLGATRGMIGGALLGLALGYALGTDSFIDAPASTALYGALFVTPLGVAAGALGGALGNTPDRYVLAPPDSLRSRAPTR